MNLQQQTKFVDEFLSRMKEVMIGKGNDYANEDRLSNFKLVGSICGLTPEQNCLSLIATKVARLGVLLGGKEPSNESIDDSLLDLANYAVLLACLREEKEIEDILKDYVDEDEPPVWENRCINFYGGHQNSANKYENELVKVGNEDR